ncbi:tRNA synthetases class II (A)-domain-containing protein [Leptodontidium sp. MPI-SDFR-AT-0119]|nr:tRNA synthetases class II (A)-domain-containing protein [Leptodontidium sp. MPI-SDFR-AT-0119]
MVPSTPGQWPAKKARDTFLDFFKERGHTFVPSSSVYKPIFLETKYIYAGGKHNDLDDVGKDSNWSFSDYFKKEAIAYSWELLTKAYGLDPDRLYVTYFEGYAPSRLGPDDEARKLISGRNAAYLNVVFVSLPSKYIDTELGFERHFDAGDTDGVDTAYRVVADHVRTSVFAISDGAVPNNVGRGYVMGDMFPEIRKKEQEVKEILDEEEQAFALSLDRGEAMFNKYAQICQSKGSKDLPGHYVWRLYDTYGFPVDLTKLMAEEQDLNIDDEEVPIAQKKAREASRGEKKGASDQVILDVHDIAALEKMGDVPTTDDTAKYEKGVVKSTIKALYFGKKFLRSTSEVLEGEQFGVLLDKTNFYAESGGQEFDTGRLVIDGVAEVDVRNVQSYRGYVLHTGYMKYGSLSVGDKILAEYDELRRQQIRMNHTGTYVLNFALREVLGGGVDQKGSLVAPEKLRFDFSHKAGYIKDDKAVFASDVDLSTARQIEGVRAVFGETYPDPVRVVSIGMAVDKLVSDVAAKDWWKYSIEFCGGTHVERTGEIKELVVLEESGIAKGIRRIVAVTSQTAVEVRRMASNFEEERLAQLERMPFSPEKETFMKETQAELARLTISTLTKKSFTQRSEKVSKDMLKEQKESQKAQVDAAIHLVDTHFEQNKASTSFVAKLPPNSSAKAVSDAIKHVSHKNKDKSVSHGCFVAPEHTSKGLVASEWVTQVAGAVGGKGGGKGATGVGSGVDASKVDEGVEVAVKYLEKLKI